MKFKNGDLVIDFEGDLTLMVATSDSGGSALIPITLSGARDGVRPYYYKSFLSTSERFLEYHRKNNYHFEVVGNLSEAFENLQELALPRYK